MQYHLAMHATCGRSRPMCFRNSKTCSTWRMMRPFPGPSQSNMEDPNVEAPPDWHLKSGVSTWIIHMNGLKLINTLRFMYKSPYKSCKWSTLQCTWIIISRVFALAMFVTISKHIQTEWPVDDCGSMCAAFGQHRRSCFVAANTPFGRKKLPRELAVADEFQVRHCMGQART